MYIGLFITRRTVTARIIAYNFGVEPLHISLKEMQTANEQQCIRNKTTYTTSLFN